MVKYNSPQLDAALAAVADPTRRAIVARLAQGPTTVGDIAEPFDMSLPAISKHLTVLERAGLIDREKVGRERHCRLRPAPLEAVSSWVQQYAVFWQHQLDSLTAFVENEEISK